MVALRISNFPRLKFNVSWIAAGQAKAELQRNGKKLMNARFFPVSFKVELSARRLRFWCVTKMLSQRTTQSSRKNFDLHTPTSLMKQNMGSETGRGGAALQRGKRLVE